MNLPVAFNARNRQRTLIIPIILKLYDSQHRFVENERMIKTFQSI